MDQDTDTITDLDDSWILEFEKEDKEYKNFYEENIVFIKVNCIYINTDLEIEKIKKFDFNLHEPNELSKEEIIYIIKQNSVDMNLKYSLLSILKYNIDLKPSSLKSFLKSPSNHNFISCIKNIDKIIFLPSIHMFQDLNEIVIVFYNNLKKSNTYHSHLNSTKKIFIKSSHRNKTMRNSFKD